MKKLVFALLALATAAISVTSCSNKEEKKQDAAAAPAKTVKAEGEKFAPTTNIRYYNMDTVMANYLLVKTYNETNLRATRELENAYSSRQGELQRMASSIQQKAQNNGYLSEASYKADVEDLNRKQQEFIDSIDNFLIDYNRDKHYDAILIYSPGQYFNPALDITNEVVEGLNARYKKTADKAADAKKEEPKK